MKTEDFKNKSAAELRQMLQEEKQRLAQLRFDLADKKLQKTSEVQRVKRVIARLMTATRAAK